jgi:transcriptional regulator with XRE-family HTH domain
MHLGLPRKILLFRAKSGWSQAELAEAVGVNQASISRWESGLGTPRRSAEVRLYNIMEGDDENNFHGKGRMSEHADSVPG